MPSKHVIKGKTEVRSDVKRGRRYTHLLNDLKETKGYSTLREKGLCEELPLEDAMDQL